jgi:hypothetical protein
LPPANKVLDKLVAFPPEGYREAKDNTPPLDVL